MASPQKENGFTPIANEILERLVNTDLLGAEFRVLLFIIRKTYGYQKKQDRISFTQFEKSTGISRQTINKTIKNLVAKGLIVKICLPGGNIGYSFIKDHDNWVVKTHLLVKGTWVTSKDVFTKTSKDVLTHKRKKEITKEIGDKSQVTPFKKYSKDGADILKEFESIDAKNKTYYANKTQREACEFLIETYGKDVVISLIPKLQETNKKSVYQITTPWDMKEKITKVFNDITRLDQNIKSKKTKYYG